MKLRRNIRYGMVGGDVFAIQRILIRDGLRHKHASRHFGRRCRRQVKRFQRMRGLEVDGVVGPQTLNVMLHARRDGRPIADPYSRHLIQHGKLGRADRSIHRPSETDLVLRYAWWCYAHSDWFSYLQQRPMQYLRCPPLVNWYSDCSEWIENAHFCAGAPAPCGSGYNLYGNTSSMLANPHGQHMAQSGKAVCSFYSYPSHVAIGVGGGRVLSHGSPGVHLLDESYRPVVARRRYVRS